MILNQEEIPTFKETVILYTLSGAVLLIGISWIAMGIQTFKNQKP